MSTQDSIIDTKWKLLDPMRMHEGVKQADMYQAYAYAREYQCPHVILLYPRFGNLNQNVANYRIHPGNNVSPKIDIQTIDISQPSNLVRMDLQQVIRSTLQIGQKIDAEAMAMYR